MLLSTANALVEANPDLSVYEGYSGRGMYGKDTCGVVGSMRMLMVAVAALMEEALCIREPYEKLSEHEFVVWQGIQRNIENLQQDSLGTQTIFY